MIVGRVSSIWAYASRSASQVVPTQVADRARAGCRRRVRRSDRAIAPAPGPSPGSRVRSSSALHRSSRWYSGLGMSRMRRAQFRPRPAAGTVLPSSRPNFTVITCQPAAANIVCSRLGRDVGHHPVQRLPVHVDDPDDLTQFGHRRVEDRLPHRALVEFGIADERVLAAACRRRRMRRRRTGARSHPRSVPWHRFPPTRSSSRPDRDPWSGSG